MNLVIDNALIHQKDFIIDKIDSGEYAEAILLLTFVKEMWQESSYGYKWHELRQRGINTINSELQGYAHWKQIQKHARMLEAFKRL